jgi:hypothetical protein
VNRREPLSPAMRVLLELGPGGLYEAHTRAPLDGFDSAYFFDGERVRAARWREHGAEITATWVLDHAGTRTWAWWSYDAPEARRCVVGTELLLPKTTPTSWDFAWRQDLGVPAFRQSQPHGYHGLPSVESQAAYLERLGLLGADERASLPADAFVPETVNPFVFTQEELERHVPPGAYRLTNRPPSRSRAHDPHTHN